MYALAPHQFSSVVCQTPHLLHLLDPLLLLQVPPTYLTTVSFVTFIVVFLDFELLDLVQFIHVEYYFNELNEFDQLFIHDDQVIYLVSSHLVFHPEYPSFNT
ncbi:hypothetical protein EDB83DRAFT_2523689 [Lactarius deliciosus]|nr:hypothetical protein EDB83DRAFT_2523689 [Lactarius deliciosus]